MVKDGANLTYMELDVGFLIVDVSVKPECLVVTTETGLLRILVVAPLMVVIIKINIVAHFVQKSVLPKN